MAVPGTSYQGSKTWRKNEDSDTVSHPPNPHCVHTYPSGWLRVLGPTLDLWLTCQDENDASRHGYPGLLHFVVSPPSLYTSCPLWPRMWPGSPAPRTPPLGLEWPAWPRFLLSGRAPGQPSALGRGASSPAPRHYFFLSLILSLSGNSFSLVVFKIFLFLWFSAISYTLRNGFLLVCLGFILFNQFWKILYFFKYFISLIPPSLCFWNYD